MSRQIGLGNTEIENYGILCRNGELGVYVAIEIDKNAAGENSINELARSIIIGEPVADNPFASLAD